MKVIKRNGSEVEFDEQKIINAIQGANKECGNIMTEQQVKDVADYVTFKCEKMNRAVNIEEIQDLVETQLMPFATVAKAYVIYRYNRMLARQANTTDDKILSLIDLKNEEVKQENSNKNPTIVSTQRDYMAGEVSKDLSQRILLPKDVVDAHNDGIIHFHDMDYFAQPISNCQLVNLEDMLQNGTVISGTLIEKPHSFHTACNIATQIIAQVASSQYGGQSITLSHLAPFVDISRKQIEDNLKSVKDAFPNEEAMHKVRDELVAKEIRAGVQTLQYQIITLMTTNGQAPFVTVYMDINEVPEGQTRDDLALIIAEVLNQRYKGVKNEKGVYITSAFPKLIYVLDENNAYKGTEYWYLTQLAVKCTAKRLVPDYISAKRMRELKEGNVFSCMGCRSFLSPWKDENGNYKFWGRFNQGVVTISLPDAALTAVNASAVKTPEAFFEKFKEVMAERLELCHKALRCRYERLKGTPSDVAPILWQHGSLARLSKGEKIDKLLENGYATISLGYAGLWECVYALCGRKLTEPEGEELGHKIMQMLNDACNKWKAEEGLGYGVYGTPLESTTYKFAKCLQKRFGVVPGVTDRNFITNSYHVHVEEKISAFDKLALEAKFQEQSLGGCISYVEVPNLQNNLDAVTAVVQFIYENIMYAELNTKSDYCQVCGFDGEIQIKDDNGKLVWECPQCGNRDQSKMNVTRRTCGYLGSNFWNQGRTQEIKNRVLHL